MEVVIGGGVDVGSGGADGATYDVELNMAGVVVVCMVVVVHVFVKLSLSLKNLIFQIKDRNVLLWILIVERVSQ